MQIKWISTSEGYGSVPIIFHWLMLLLIVAAYLTMDIKSFFPKGGASRDAIANLHFMFGMSVFVLVWFRLFVRIAGVRPVIVPPMPSLQDYLAKTMHLILYVLMIGLPLLGWLTLSARGKPVPFFFIEMPALIDKSPELAKLLKEVHESFATVGYVIIGLHAAAALYHHYVKHDNVMSVMLPGNRSKQN